MCPAKDCWQRNLQPESSGPSHLDQVQLPISRLPVIVDLKGPLLLNRLDGPDVVVVRRHHVGVHHGAADRRLGDGTLLRGILQALLVGEEHSLRIQWGKDMVMVTGIGACNVMDLLHTRKWSIPLPPRRERPHLDRDIQVAPPAPVHCAEAAFPDGLQQDQLLSLLPLHHAHLQKTVDHSPFDIAIRTATHTDHLQSAPPTTDIIFPLPFSDPFLPIVIHTAFLSAPKQQALPGPGETVTGDQACSALLAPVADPPFAEPLSSGPTPGRCRSWDQCPACITVVTSQKGFRAAKFFYFFLFRLVGRTWRLT